MSEQDRERMAEAEPMVLEGDDQMPHLPAPPLDPYTPEPGPRPGEGRAFQWMRLSLVVIAIAVAVILYAALK